MSISNAQPNRDLWLQKQSTLLQPRNGKMVTICLRFIAEENAAMAGDFSCQNF